MNGYFGKIAFVDLSSTSSETHVFDEEFARKYIGGSGMGTYFLLSKGKAGFEPFHPESPLIYMTGPFMGSGIPTSGRHQITARSPLTGAFGEADAGGSFGFHLRRAGFDGLVITGKSEKPVAIVLEDGDIRVVDASFCWGLDTFATEAAVREKIANDAGVSCIGPAGERLLPLAGIFHDGPHARAAGRGGLGAVMGSKNLKAVVARGGKSVNFADRSKLTETIIPMNELLKEKGAGLNLYGTAGGMENAEKSGDLPLKNWKLGSGPETASALSGQTMAEKILSSSYGCVACPIRCGREVRLDGEEVAGPEYESLAMLGSSCLVGDLDAVARANDLCNRWGMDTISTGSAIAFGMELYESGIVSEKDIGRPLRWGDGEALIEMVKDIAEVRGFGKVLGQGTRKAAELVGNGAEEFAIQTKGMELPAHDPRCFKGLACGYATSSRGACHLSSFTYPWERSATFPEFGYEKTVARTQDTGKGEMTARFQDLMCIADSVKICKFPLILGVKVETLSNWLKSVTGWDVSPEELLETGRRITTMKRLYNVGTGLDRKDDSLPRRILEEPRGTGGSPDTLPDLKMQLEEYYRFRGWDERGRPGRNLLEELGIGEFSNWLEL